MLTTSFNSDLTQTTGYTQRSPFDH